MLKLKKETEGFGPTKVIFFLMGNKSVVRQKLCLLNLYAINNVAT